MSARIKDVDKGLKRLVRNVKPLGKGRGLSVGIHAAEGARQHSKAPDDKSARELTIVEIGAFNEFGLGVPERSFIRAWFDEGKTVNHAALKRAVERVMRGEITAEQALDQLGLQFVGEVQKRISQGVPPPNAPATIRRKGSSKPLIDRGQLRQSLTHKVVGRSSPGST